MQTSGWYPDLKHITNEYTAVLWSLTRHIWQEPHQNQAAPQHLNVEYVDIVRDFCIP